MKLIAYRIISILLCLIISTTVLGDYTKINENNETIFQINGDIQVNEEWVVRYDRIEEPKYPQIVGGQCIALDPTGNVYVTGASSGNGTGPDYITISYDTNGNERWTARYDGPGSWDDKPTGIATDSKGNVYVTGISFGDRLDYDYATVAYDSLGNELWVARYDGPGKNSDMVLAITVNQSGNVFVTGYSENENTNSDYATVAYDPSGKQLWVARYNGPGDYDDFPKAITTDSMGNVYVTGWSAGNGTAFDYATVAYDISGNELWVARYDGPLNGSDYAYSIDLDPMGNVYVTGSSLKGSYPEPGTDFDYATIAYDRNGNELWTARYERIKNEHDWAYDIATDLFGNIYVTGNSGENKTDYVTVSYDSLGRIRWETSYDGPENSLEYATCIVTDSLGNIYVTGRSQVNGTVFNYKQYDYATVAYDVSGNELWVARYNGPGNSSDVAYDMAIDQLGNVYVTGISIGIDGSYDFATIKYSQEIANKTLDSIIDIDPNTLNLKSKGRWITCYIDIPDYDVNDIDISSVMFEDTIPAEWGDIQGKTLMVKFDRSEVEELLSPGTYVFKITGELIDGTKFEGYSDEIKVIDPPKK